MELYELDLLTVAAKIKNGELTSVEVTKAALDQIDRTKHLNAFVTVAKEQAMLKASEVDNRIAKGEQVGTLAGVPIGVKDNISTLGIRTTCASKFLENYVPPFDAEVVRRLKAADAVIVGKANMDEFAMGSASENSAYGAVKNGVDPTCVAGGSSGGSATMVAANQVYASLGSDTGGSIRQPASFNGVVGLKPTYSAVSRFGLIAFASSLDQIGPIARNVKDTAALYSVIYGYDSKDSTSSKEYKFSTQLDTNMKGKRIGIAKEFFSEALNSTVKARIMDAVKVYERLGATVVETSIKSFEAALATYYVLSSAEAASNLARYDGVKYGARVDKNDDYIDMYYNTRTKYFGDEVKRRIMVGNYVLSSGYYDAYYLKASKIRTLIKEDFDKAFAVCDALVCPTAPNTAWKIGQKASDPAEVYLSDIYTVPVNIAGIPALSVPCGLDDKGLPIGMQLIGNTFTEQNLLGIALAYEEATR